MGERLESNAANVTIRNKIDAPGIILNHEHILAKKNMIWSWNRICHVLSNINAERFKWRGMQKLFNLFSHGGEGYQRSEGKSNLIK
jgi:hypothetical protein